MRCAYCDRPGDLCNRVEFRPERDRDVCDRCFDDLLAQADLERERREEHGLSAVRDRGPDDLPAAEASEEQRRV